VVGCPVGRSVVDYRGERLGSALGLTLALGAEGRCCNCHWRKMPMSVQMPASISIPRFRRASSIADRSAMSLWGT
jgi:hypothetical protein